MRRRADDGRVGAAVATLLVLTVGPGCYVYRPTELADIRPHEQVRIVLENRSYDYGHLGSAAPREIAPRLEGDVLRLTDDSLALSIWIGQAYRGTSFQMAHETATVPRNGIVTVERREFSSTRTALVAAGVVGIVAYFISQVVFSPDPNPGDNGSPPPPPPGG